MARCFVGTSGWAYSWNPDGLEWYVENSGLDAVEVNSTFYRLPRGQLVARWARVGAGLRWSVKIHRRVSHVHRLNEKALAFWRVFRSRLSPLDPLVEFYLLQLPPSYRPGVEAEERLRRFAEEAGLGPRLAVEFRHPSWWGPGRPGAALARELGFTLVSVDAPPPVGRMLWASGGRAYLRLHGSTVWYGHRYTREELEELARGLLGLGASENYAFFNNDHAMLDNAREMRRIMDSAGCPGGTSRRGGGAPQP
jgi:uncharacterized protein YecE (DUF72 family)